jgi:hypothetical protein
MDTILIVIIFSHCSKNRANSDIQTALADSVYNSHLNFIRAVIDDKKLIESKEGTSRLDSVIHFLEVTTGIRSQREGTYLGLNYVQDASMREDYSKWNTWYDNNRGLLRWDKKTGKVVLDQ